MRDDRSSAFRAAVTAVCVLAVSGLLCGCMAANLAVGAASIANSGGPLFDAPQTDSAFESIKIPGRTGDQFVADMKTIAGDLGYQIQGVDGHGQTVRGIGLLRQSRDILGAAIGRDWAEALALNLEEDGKTVQIQAKTKGNNHRGDPGTAQKLIEEVKVQLNKLYASSQ